MINGYVRTVLDRLPGIRSDIVRNDDNWQEWEFPQFVTALEKWTQWFNCTGKDHRAPDCRSKRTCSTCNERRHSSTCSKPYPSVPTMSSTDQGDLTHPLVAILVDRVKCRALLDTGAGSSYVSAGLMNVLRKTPIRKETKHIEMTMYSANKIIEFVTCKSSMSIEMYHLRQNCIK